MGVCWYCHWGWPQQVAEIYDRAAAGLGYDSPLLYGRSHIVWEDENFEDDHIKFCLEQSAGSYVFTAAEDAIVIRSLKELLAIPESIRCCVPEDYDDEHPELFPPPTELAMVKR
jgi:hypothetical protein